MSDAGYILAVASKSLAWREPLEAACALEGAPGRLCLISGAGARWSYVMAAPRFVERLAGPPPAAFGRMRTILQKEVATEPPSDAPPFTGGLVGLASYDLAAPRAALGDDPQAWPGLTLASYNRALVFDHHQRRLTAVGRGPARRDAEAQADAAAAWLDRPVTRRNLQGPLAKGFQPDRPGAAYEAAAADVVRRIGEGEVFQANIARSWSGRLSAGVQPFDLFARLVERSPAPYAAFWDLGDRALVSNSPEAFLEVRDGKALTRPIKGTRPRGETPQADADQLAELERSEKDRAENLMIVDLMRNDLSRVCAPGSVRTTELFRLESFANVHHLVSTVEGRLEDGVSVADVLEAAFPPGSITGAPKHQAMKVISGHEAGRGPWCGSLFLAGGGGTLSASVLIRTVALTRDADGWDFRTLAGAGIVADSDPAMERAETDAKIDSIRRALTEG